MTVSPVIRGTKRGQRPFKIWVLNYLINLIDTSRDKNTTTRLTDKVNVQDPDVTLRTQTSVSNTCLIHSFQFIYDIVCKRRPTPMRDSIAEQNRSVLANQLWQNMDFVGERHEHSTYPGKYIN